MTAQAGAVAAWLITWNDGTQSVGFDPCHEDDGTCVPLYTTPPAAVPAEALEGLALAWEAEAHSDRLNSGHCAYALRQLIKERSNG